MNTKPNKFHSLHYIILRIRFCSLFKHLIRIAPSNGVRMYEDLPLLNESCMDAQLHMPALVLFRISYLHRIIITCNQVSILTITIHIGNYNVYYFLNELTN